MEEQNHKETTLDDVLVTISISSSEIQGQIESLKKDLGGKIKALEIKVGDMDGKMNVMSDDIKKVKDGVEKTADILEQKQVINTVERQQIYHATDPFALPA